jgi:hypothetical protein
MTKLNTTEQQFIKLIKQAKGSGEVYMSKANELLTINGQKVYGSPRALKRIQKLVSETFYNNYFMAQ